ncbi:hypothetical protein [Croceibacterium mercuriale]|uniref:hypothetical protein n=1 Tax=Croceibacterium mercuriale TaxID=1572751 RepID=UPI00068A5113|nr:hypothetical protein [Croceibacterium mercuriale]
MQRTESRRFAVSAGKRGEQRRCAAASAIARRQQFAAILDRGKGRVGHRRRCLLHGGAEVGRRVGRTQALGDAEREDLGQMLSDALCCRHPAAPLD